MEKENDHISRYRDALNQLIAGTMTYSDFFYGAREQLLLALCRGLVVDGSTRKQLNSLEQQASNLGLL